MGDGYQGRFACHTSAWERTRKCQNNQARLLSTLMRMTVVVEMTMGVILVRYWFYILSWRRWVVFVGILVKNDSGDDGNGKANQAKKEVPVDGNSCARKAGKKGYLCTLIVASVVT